MSVFVSYRLLSPVIHTAIIYLAGVSRPCSLFLFNLFYFSLCFLRILLVRPSCLFCLHPSSFFFLCECLSMITWSTLVSVFVLTDSKGQDKAEARRNILSSWFAERHAWIFLSPCPFSGILLYWKNITSSKKLSIYYRIRIRRSQSAFQMKMIFLPSFHKILFIGGIYLQWLSSFEELLLGLIYFWRGIWPPQLGILIL